MVALLVTQPARLLFAARTGSAMQGHAHAVIAELGRWRPG